MRRVLAIVTLALSTPFASADRAYLSVEDSHTRKSLPREVVEALTNRHVLGGDDRVCKLVGERISLTGSPAKEDYFVTTAQGCGGGSAQGPFWLVRRTNNSYKQVLESGAALVRLKDEKKHGLKSIVLIEGNAGVYGETHLEFTGRKYRVKWARAGSSGDWCGEMCSDDK